MKVAHEISEALQVSKARVKADPRSKQVFELSGHQELQSGMLADTPKTKSGLLKLSFSFNTVDPVFIIQHKNILKYEIIHKSADKKFLDVILHLEHLPK